MRVDFERAGGDEIESAAGRHRETLHIIKSRQDPEVERRDDFAQFAFTEVERNWTSVFVDQQIGQGTDAEGLQELVPGRRHPTYLVIDGRFFQSVADLVGAAGEYRAAPRRDKTL